LLVAANPLPPRTIQISYSINTGAQKGAGYARGARSGGSLRAAAAAKAGASPAPRRPAGIGAFGFGELHFVAPPDGTSPLAVAATRAECTADLQPLATAALAQLGAAATAYAAGTSPLPTVTGISVTPRGDPQGAWFFGLGPEIPRDLFARPQNGGNGGAPRPPRRPGGGAGGPPPAFQPNISVAPNSAPEAPRPQFTPSSALIAALQPFKALISCSYATVLTPDEAKTRGFNVPAPGVPGVRPSPAPSPSPGAGPAPRGGPRGPGAGFIQYAPSPGLFVVRVPDLGTGGGSVKQP
jgi:hypothetical protein